MRRFRDKLISSILPRSRRSRQGSDPVNAPGLHLVYGSDNAAVDIVAIHGLGGTWDRSWTDLATGTFWLRDLLPKSIPECRVLSYGYEASGTSTRPMEDIALQMLSELSELRSGTDSETRPIIFLAHSLGGPILKGALASTHGLNRGSDHGNIRSSTYGILFFGTPRRGEDAFSSLAASTSTEVAGGLPESPLMAALKRDLLWMRESNTRFSEICHAFVIKYFLEAANDGAVVTTALGSTDLDADVTSAAGDDIPLNKSHGQMIRFPDENDPDYRKVSICLVAMVVEISN